MDTKPRGLSTDLEGVAVSPDRLVCHQLHHTSSNVFLPSARSSGSGDGCSSTRLVQPGSLCVSPDSVNQKSHQHVGPVDESISDFDRALLASAGVVSGSFSKTDRLSQRASPVEEAAQTAPHGQIPRKRRLFKASRVASIERGLKKKGFSSGAASRIARPHRPSTTKLYESKWTVFSDWCNQRGIAPRRAFIAQAADFFLFLREESKLSSSALKGFRSALSQIFYLCGLDLSGSPDISALFKNFDQERIATEPKVPGWDLSLVLISLRRAPFEPLEKASLRTLTLKTVFLLALASAKRVSEIHALSHVVSHSHDWSRATFSFVTDFVAKTQVPGRSSRLKSFQIPALTSILGGTDLDATLCPVRALRLYLQRTKSFRPKRDRLFVSTNSKTPKSIAKNTISFWIRKVVRLAYEAASEDDRVLCKIKAHEVRALATSLLFKKNSSVEEVMSAASWRCNSTFASFF